MSFTIGPPEPVTDARRLPAVDAEDEAGFVSGADLGADHPDNAAADDLPVVAVQASSDDDDDEPLPSEAEVAALVADVDTDAIDAVGFDASDTDLPEPAGSRRGGS